MKQSWKKVNVLALVVLDFAKPPKTHGGHFLRSHSSFKSIAPTQAQVSPSRPYLRGIPRRRFTTSTMHTTASCNSIPATLASRSSRLEADAMSVIDSQSAILRYSPGDERFQFKLTLKTGKVFNFDRAAGEPLQSFVDRMITNLSKKLKTFEGGVSFLKSLSSPTPSQSGEESWEVVPNSVIIEDLFKELLTGGIKLRVKIDDDTFDLALNPPEIFAVKFFKEVFAGFPILPVKIESSPNFRLEVSKFLWEYAASDASTVETDKKKRSNSVSKVRQWKVGTSSSNLIFTPEQDKLGSVLRFTCVPSDGQYFGLPFKAELPSPVLEATFHNPLFEERLARICPKSEFTDDPAFIRVVSYNCLADTYATPEWFVASPKESLPPDFRIPFLNKELKSYDADIYCLQEVDEKYFETQFVPYLEQNVGCKGVFSCKLGNTKEGVATFYNTEKFDLLQNKTVVILEHMKLQSFWNAVSSLSEEFLNRLLDRNTVLQVSILKSKCSPNTVVVVANTHLYFHPDADHIRLLQTITCVDYITKIVDETKKAFPAFRVTLLFCGDFNCTPPFSSYRFLTSGEIKENDEDWTSHLILDPSEKIMDGININHDLKLKNPNPGEELTNITTAFEGCIDYILYQPEFFKVIKTYPPPDKAKIASIIGVDETRKVSLPNFHTPSDHLPLIVDLSLL